MQVRKKLKPGQAGTRGLLDKYGDQLICVRYRYDEERRLRYKTVELIVETTPWLPAAIGLPANAVIGLRVAFGETELQDRIRQAGGKWNRALKYWELRYDQAVALGLKSRIEPSTLPISRKKPLPNSGKEKPPTIRQK